MKQCLRFEDGILIENDSEGSQCTVGFDEAYSNNEFIKGLNLHKLDCHSDYANEFFLYFYIRLFEMSSILQKYSTFESNCRPWRIDWNLFRLAQRKPENGKVTPLVRMVHFSIFCIGTAFGLFLTTAFYIYALTRVKNVLRRTEAKERRKIYLVRSKSGAGKLARIGSNGRDLFVGDDLFGYSGACASVYSPVRWRRSLKVLWSSIRITIRDYRTCISDAILMFDELTATTIIIKYAIRISHKALYESCLLHILMESNPGNCIYSSNKEDRFAILETRLCRSLGLPLLCVPHGLEYGFRFPMGLCGTVFYCNSPHAAAVLNDLYNERKFVYSEEITARIFSADRVSGLGEKPGLCYFSEPRDAHVNFEIIEWMLAAQLKFCVKLHPLDDKISYLHKFPGLKIISSLDEALEYRFCAARKSTVLLEAAYRSRIPIAILINQKDRVYCEHVFPALSDSRIKKIYALDELPRFLASKDCAHVSK